MSIAPATGCRQPNASHCANIDGDATCRARSASAPFCDACAAADDGCVADAEAIEPRCRSGNGESAGDEAASTDPTTISAATADGSGSTGDGSASSGPPPGTDTTEAGDTSDSGGSGPSCGNGLVEDGEDCDGQALGGETCRSLGLPAGTLACESVACVYDTSACCLSLGQRCGGHDECCSGVCSGMIAGCVLR